MTTLIRGKASDWTPEIWELWSLLTLSCGRVLQANYFTPRPYVDEYNRGDPCWGFVYVCWNNTTLTRQVWLFKTLQDPESWKQEQRTT